MTEQNTVVNQEVVATQTLESLGLVEGLYEITAHPKHKGLVGRKVRVTKAGKKPGLVNGHLLHHKSGLEQKTEISIAAEAIKLFVAPVEAPVEQAEAAQEEAAVV